MNTAKLSKKYQIVVPREVRKQMNLRQGARVALYPLDDERAILMKYPSNHVGALKGLGAEVWRSLGGAEKYIKEERASWEK